MKPEQLQRLGELGFEAVALGDRGRHVCFARAPFAALVEMNEESCRIGAAGLITGRGLAVLLWRDGAAHFIAKGFEQAAAPGEVEALRDFQADLERCLKDPPVSRDGA